jgi:galactitol-specific phosphotransferase system IIB component
MTEPRYNALGVLRMFARRGTLDAATVHPDFRGADLSRYLNTVQHCDRLRWRDLLGLLDINPLLLRVSRNGSIFNFCKSIEDEKMELSFACENGAEASRLAQELELALRKQGIPPVAISLKQSSSENMDVGSVLWISIEALNQVLGPIGSVATLASCIHQIMSKYNRDAIVDNEEGRLRIPASRTTLSRVKAALAKPPRTKNKSKSKVKSI